MLRFQTILLSLMVLGFLPISTMAADDAEPAKQPLDDIASESLDLTIQQDNNIMIRQLQTIDGFEPLMIAGQQINAAFLEETLGEPQGAIVLFHDQGEALESWGVVTPLRHEMLKFGWSTLTLSLEYSFTPNILLAVKANDVAPIIPAPLTAESNPDKPSSETQLPTDSEPGEEETKKNETSASPLISNTQRIEAAINLLQAKGINRIVFLGHGRGGIVAVNELKTIISAVSAVILVGVDAMAEDEDFKALTLPVLDIYGDQDLAGVSAAVHRRKVDMKRNGNNGYTSREIIGANHQFYGLEPMLRSTVRGWLNTTFVKQENSK